MLKRAHLGIVPAQFLVFGSIPGAFGSDEGLLATDPNAGRNQSYSASSPLSGRLAGCSDGPHDTPSQDPGGRLKPHVDTIQYHLRWLKTSQHLRSGFCGAPGGGPWLYWAQQLRFRGTVSSQVREKTNKIYRIAQLLSISTVLLGQRHHLLEKTRLCALNRPL